MLKKRAPDFHELVWQAATRVGNSAPRVTNEIVETAFPATLRCARDEGAEKMLRRGIISEVKRILRAAGEDADQHDFSQIDPVHWDAVRELKSRSYFVEGTDEYVSVPRLINEPDLLDDARRFMRKKGLECIAEANRLDDLYLAVTDESPPRPASAEGAAA